MYGIAARNTCFFIEKKLKKEEKKHAIQLKLWEMKMLEGNFWTLIIKENLYVSRKIELILFSFIRYLVATRDIRAGEILFEEVPLAVGPNAISTPQCILCHCKVSKFWNHIKRYQYLVS